jgi:Protein of unknown function (DUF2695)
MTEDWVRKIENSLWQPSPVAIEIMTPESPRWEEFAEALYVGLNWKEGETPEGTTLKCYRDHRFAKAVMTCMGSIDIEKSLAFFKGHGGHCDCMILMNVEDSVERGKGDE